MRDRFKLTQPFAKQKNGRRHRPVFFSFLIAEVWTVQGSNPGQREVPVAFDWVENWWGTVDMLASQVSSQESERIKKRFYISGEDEYSCSSDPLNGL